MLKGGIGRSGLNLPFRGSKSSASARNDWTPLLLNTQLWGWIDFSKTENIILSGSNISSLVDVSSGLVWSNANSAGRPLLVTNFQNERSVARYDGVNDVLTCSVSDTATNTFAYAAVCAPVHTISINSENNNGTSGTSGQRWLFDPTSRGSGGGSGVSVGTNGIGVYEHGNSYLPCLASYSGTLSGFNIVLVTYVLGLPRIYLNGTLVRHGIQSTGNGINVIYAPRHIGGTVYGTFSGDVGEGVIITGSLTESDRALLEGFLAWNWAISSKLPSDHTYKNVRP